MTAKIAPMNENDQCSKQRPSTADDTFGKAPKRRTRNHSESWSNHPANGKDSGKFSYDNEADSSDEHLGGKNKYGANGRNTRDDVSGESDSDINTMERPKPQMTGTVISRDLSEHQ